LHPRHARAYDELSATWRALTAGRPSDSERVNEIVSMARR
jgi:ferric-dicitrate binding protein FerR (iron transport regulator)